jgi:AcrR family transcriptional regulator
MVAATGKALFDRGEPRARRTDGRGPGRPSRAQVEARNRELLDTALDLFLQRGFEGTTIEAIVDAVGMARRTVYSRYGDKEGLFKAALEGAIGQWVVPPEQLSAAECDDLEQNLLAVAQMMVANVRTPGGMRLVRIANAEIFRMPEIREYLWERIAEVALRWLTDFFARRIAPEVAADSADAFLLLIVDGAFQMQVWQGAPPDEFERRLAFRVRLFCDGVRGIGQRG